MEYWSTCHWPPHSRRLQRHTIHTELEAVLSAMNTSHRKITANYNTVCGVSYMYLRTLILYCVMCADVVTELY